MKLSNTIRSLLIPAGFLLAAQTQAVEVQVKVENLSPQGGLYFTPLWVGFHDGSFDVYDRGAAASVGVERFAEDGDFAALVEVLKEFDDLGVLFVDGDYCPKDIDLFNMYFEFRSRRPASPLNECSFEDLCSALMTAFPLAFVIDQTVDSQA